MKKSLFVVVGVALLAVVGLAVSAPYGPTVVATVTLTGQTSTSGPTTLYTPTEDGNYLVTAYVASNASGAGTDTVNFSWTDEFRANSVNLVSHNALNASPSSADDPIHVASGNAIQYTSTIAGYAAPASFDVFITVTKE